MRSQTIAILTLSLLLVGSVSALAINVDTEKFSTENKNYVIPDWVKHNADWWSRDLITDSEFSYTIQHLINEGVIIVDDCNGRCIDGDYE